MKSVLYGLFLLLILFPLSLSAQEEILVYHSNIEVLADGSMLVEEQIKVRAEQQKIKRGIYRDFPTSYEDRLGNAYRVGFDLQSVERDGSTESYHTEDRSNGVRIYIGARDHYLKNGIYNYTLRYRTTRQLGFFQDHDELYWNVTGNEWDFPINQASARVIVPPGISIDDVGVEAYTGPQGGRGDAYQAGVEGGEAWFVTDKPLAPNEGLTIVTTWPKGYVTEPSREERVSWFLQDNRSVLVSGVGIALLLLYYLSVWHRVGRDPESGVIIPHYTPPKGYSPASMRFIQRMGYDNQAFGAAVVNMAVSGYLRIQESGSGSFSLHKTGEMPKLAAGEGAIASALFASGTKSVSLIKSNHQKIGKAVKAHKSALKRDYEKRYFSTNSGYLLPGVALSIGIVIAGLVTMLNVEQRMVTGFMAVWLTGWTFGTYALISAAWKAWRSAFSGAGNSYAGAVTSTLFAVPFLGGEFMGIGMLIDQGSPMLAGVLAILVAINITFYQWMKAPTLTGRKLLDKVEGFALYLSVAEQEELAFKHPPEKTPELFEHYLPYAIALGVEQQWGERFSAVLASTQANGGHYRPHWYRGESWDHHNLSGFSSAVGGAMTSAIASSSTAPGSSSGSGGGGSSGGGGGGGGGGGW
ncbi:MAG: DUF2207 domain-containing protein [Gammaproteobacteria bacterium]|nr:DUF2207 domain-containing protein [Gammaproteobacteria bacterium]